MAETEVQETEVKEVAVAEDMVLSIDEAEKAIREENEEILKLGDAVERLLHNPDFKALEKHYFADYGEAQTRLCGSYTNVQIQDMVRNLGARGILHRVIQNILDDKQAVLELIDSLKEQEK